MEHSDFVVHLNKIPPEGFDLEFEIASPGEAGVELSVPVEGPVQARFAVERLGNEIRVRGAVRATVSLECSRCLAPFAFPIDADVDATFVPPTPADDTEHQHELSAAELEVQPLVQGAADLRGVIAEQIHLALPLKPLCSESCGGLGPRSGDGPVAVDPRWEVLKKLAVP